MYCRKCGKQIPDDSNVCQYCGVKTTVDEDSSPSGRISLNDGQAGSFRNSDNDVDKQIADGASDSASEQNVSGEAKAGATKGAQPKNKTIAIAAIAAVVVVAIVVVAVFALGGRGSSDSAGSAGNVSSEPIVGEWKVAAVSTDEDDMSSFTSGGATIKNDGSISVNLTGGSGLKMSGTWKAEPKSNWPDVDDLIGFYDISLTMDGSKGGFTGAVTKSGSEYTLFLLLDKTDTSLVFTRSA